MAARERFGRDYYIDIRHHRLKGWTDRRIARELGMSRATLYRIVARYSDNRKDQRKSR